MRADEARRATDSSRPHLPLVMATASDPFDSARSRLRGLAPRTWVRRLVGVVILAVAIYLVHRLVSAVGWEEVRERLADASLPALGLAALLLVLQLALWSTRQWVGVRRITATPSAWAVFLSLVATAAANYMIPFARLVGGLLRARYLSRASRPRAPKRIYYGAVLFDQTAHMAVMGAFTLTGLVAGAALLDRPLLAVTIALVLIVAAIGVTLWIRHRASGDGGVVAAFIRFLERRADRQQGMAGSFFSGSETAAKIYFRLLGSGSLWRLSALIGLGVFAAVAASQWVVFYALGDPIDPLLVVTTLAIGLTAGVLLGTPGGLGTTEATMIALYGTLGVDPVDAASAVLLFRGIQFAVVLGLGLPGMLVLEVYGEAVRERPAPDLTSDPAANGTSVEAPGEPSSPERSATEGLREAPARAKSAERVVETVAETTEATG